MEKIRYSIISCGNVAGDYKNKQKIEGIYTHADALSRIKAIKPIAYFDLYYKKALKFKKRWGFENAFSDLNSLNKLNNELIVSAKTSSHYSVLNGILKIKNKPKIVLCEKLLITNRKQCLEIYN